MRLYALLCLPKFVGVIGLSGVSDTCSEESVSNQVALFIKNFLTKAVDGNADSIFFNWGALVHGFISMGSSITDKEFKQILPYLDDAIARFLK